MALEKCAQPKKPLCADNGDGCTPLSTQCFLCNNEYSIIIVGLTRTTAKHRNGMNICFIFEGNIISFLVFDLCCRGEVE